MGYPYTKITDPQSNDLVMMWDNSRSGWSVCAWSDLFSLIQENLELPDAGIQEPLSQYSAPSATGFDIVVNDSNVDVHLIITPSGTFADGNIILPATGNVRDKQILIVNSTQEVTALTIDGNGAAGVHGAPTTLSANGYFTLKYDATVNAWYRIG